jgi:hypothetical protein
VNAAFRISSVRLPRWIPIAKSVEGDLGVGGWGSGLRVWGLGVNTLISRVAILHYF